MKKNFLYLIPLLFIGMALFAETGSSDTSIRLNWLDTNRLAQPAGVSWGVPWKKGQVKKNQQFILQDSKGKAIAVQSWPLAYWPDGSIKWTGFATVAESGNNMFTLSVQKDRKAAASPAAMQVKETARSINVVTGSLKVVIPKSGRYLIDSLLVQGNLAGNNGRLECILQNGPEGDDYSSPSIERYISNVKKVTVEQNGAVRTVIRIEGNMQSENGRRNWLPFSIRLYFYNGSSAIRMVNTVIYDGNEQKDFIKGLGLAFSIPMHDAMHNRHVRFAGEADGIWGEPVRPLVGRGPFMLNGKEVFADQQAGKPVAGIEAFQPRTQAMIKDLPVWNDYRLIQHTADAFTIDKRTNNASTWLDANAGKRATGFVFVGDTKGSLGIGLKDFWQSYPSAVEVRNAAKDVAELKVWLWSPYQTAMDMRHYDTVAHGLDATYEDVQPGLSTPYGIARTSELMIFPGIGVPSNELISNQARTAAQPPLLVNIPEYLHEVKAFGAWSLPDRSSPGKRWIEGELDKAVNFYKKEIDQRNWYGFWNYGDVMHAYDPVRHSWKYDIGGFAWDNTELSTDMWLWYSYLRSGRADIFRMAEAMTRHTSEVDVYHIGKLAGLGSRHNVRHWGCGSKEVRESQAAYRRFYYYLTTDERTGDMMREVAASADIAMSNLDPLRLILPKSAYSSHARIGPDWLALVGNWMTEWERTGDRKWRDKIMAGVNSFAAMPYGFFSGAQAAFGYDTTAKTMHQLNDTIGFSHLSILMGGPEIAYELTDLLQDPKWNKLWLQFTSLYGAPREDINKAFGRNVSLGAPGPWYARMPAFAAEITKDQKYVQRAWNEFLGERTRSQFDSRIVKGADALKPLEEVPGISTNNTAQWCLNAIQLLELVGDQMPGQHALWTVERNQEIK